MDYHKALSFTFDDKDWPKKIAIGGFFNFLNVFFCFFIVGYYMGLLRNVQRRAEVLLPDWSDMGKIIVDGVVGSIILLLYTLLIGGLCALAIIYFATESGLDDAGMVISIVMVSILTVVGLTVLGNLALLQFTFSDDFRDAFSLTKMLQMGRAHGSDLIGVTVFSLILNGLMFVVGLGLLSPFTSFWAFVVQGHLFAQCVQPPSDQ